MPDVILVDSQDNPIGVMEKMLAHQTGQLHRAFSIFVFNDHEEVLLHRRALTKYHSPGLWTNTCCSHPMPGEDVTVAAYRRLQEEMGMTCALVKSFDFVYHAQLENDLIEHEFDHVFFGRSNDIPVINPDEVCEWKWMKLCDIYIDSQLHPEKYTEWFKIALPEVMKQIKLQLV